MECAYRYKLIYIDKLGTFSSTPHLGLGTGVHDVNENYIKTRVMDKSIAFDYIKKTWDDNLELFTNGPFPDWAPKGFGTVDDWIKKASMIMDDVPGFLDTKFPGWTCHDAEELLYERIDNHRIKFKGLVDAVIRVPGKKGKDFYQILDWKTCGWGWAIDKQRDFKTQLQLILYKNFWAAKHDVPLKDIKCAFVLLKRDGKPGKSIGMVPVSVGPTTSGRGLKVIDNHVKAVERKLFLKNKQSCKFCEFAGTDRCKADF